MLGFCGTKQLVGSPGVVIVVCLGLSGAIGQLLVHSDLKRFVASASILHMAIAMYGFLGGSRICVNAATLGALMHSIIAVVAFGLVGSIYESAGSRCSPTCGVGSPGESMVWSGCLTVNSSFPVSLAAIGELVLSSGLVGSA